MNTSSVSMGQLTLDLPRSLIDAKKNNTDTGFKVAVDGKQANFTETKTNSERTLVIDIPPNAREADLIGTQSVPEFGSTFQFILVIALVSIIAILRLNYYKN